ncbi:hypothetical protein Pelo_13435 [Pelomyxa schiedti]|nr:hypothetical protein Pelo_13435 [Pelomyxa schiedti]
MHQERPCRPTCRWRVCSLIVVSVVFLSLQIVLLGLWRPYTPTIAPPGRAATTSGSADAKGIANFLVSLISSVHSDHSPPNLQQQIQQQSKQEQKQTQEQEQKSIQQQQIAVTGIHIAEGDLGNDSSLVPVIDALAENRFRVVDAWFESDPCSGKPVKASFLVFHTAGLVHLAFQCHFLLKVTSESSTGRSLATTFANLSATHNKEFVEFHTVTASRLAHQPASAPSINVRSCPIPAVVAAALPSMDPQLWNSSLTDARPNVYVRIHPPASWGAFGDKPGASQWFHLLVEKSSPAATANISNPNCHYPPWMAHYQLSAVIMFRIFAEDSFHITLYELIEWMESLFLAGVEHIYAYDNYMFLQESQLPQLDYYIKRGLLTYHPWPYKKALKYAATQKMAYTHCLYKYHYTSEWQWQADVDEYPLIHADQTPGFLLRFAQRQPRGVYNLLFYSVFYGRNISQSQLPSPEECNNQNSCHPWCSRPTLIERFHIRANPMRSLRWKPLYKPAVMSEAAVHLMTGAVGHDIPFEEGWLLHYWGDRCSVSECRIRDENTSSVWEVTLRQTLERKFCNISAADSLLLFNITRANT